ncbi:unnamed protein product [Cunninghamella echinulata]
MTRGNQREQARLKNLKKQQAASKGKSAGNQGVSLTKKKESDAAIMRAKQEAAAAKKAGETEKK